MFVLLHTTYRDVAPACFAVGKEPMLRAMPWLAIDRINSGRLTLRSDNDLERSEIRAALNGPTGEQWVSA